MLELSDLTEEYKTVEDLDPIFLEFPFLYKGMPVEAYFEERDYYVQHWVDAHEGKYTPLWKQRGEIHEKFTGSL